MNILPILVVHHKSAQARACLDYGVLNRHIVNHPGSDAACCSETLRTCRTITDVQTLDLTKAYLQLYIRPDLWKYQIIIYNEIIYCLTRLRSGLSIAPRCLRTVLQYVLKDTKCAIYIDDIIFF